MTPMPAGGRRPSAATTPGHDDERLRGRTYAIPFDDVWNAALRVVRSAEWRVLRADDREGVIHALATTRVLGFVDDVSVRIRLDANAQTRVDARSASRRGRYDFGSNARRLRRFFQQLDALAVHTRDERLARRGGTPAAAAPALTAESGTLR